MARPDAALMGPRGLWATGVMSNSAILSSNPDFASYGDAFGSWLNDPAGPQDIIDYCVANRFGTLYLTVQSWRGAWWSGSSWPVDPDVAATLATRDPIAELLAAAAIAEVEVFACFNTSRDRVHDGTNGYPNWISAQTAGGTETELTLDMNLPEVRDAIVARTDEVMTLYAEFAGVVYDYIRFRYTITDPAEIATAQASTTDIVTRTRNLASMAGKILMGWQENSDFFRDQGNLVTEWVNAGLMDFVQEGHHSTTDGISALQHLMSFFGLYPGGTVINDPRKILPNYTTNRYDLPGRPSQGADEFDRNLARGRLLYEASAGDTFLNIMDTDADLMAGGLTRFDDPAPQTTKSADFELDQTDLLHLSYTGTTRDAFNTGAAAAGAAGARIAAGTVAGLLTKPIHPSRVEFAPTIWPQWDSTTGPAGDEDQVIVAGRHDANDSIELKFDAATKQYVLTAIANGGAPVSVSAGVAHADTDQIIPECRCSSTGMSLRVVNLTQQTAGPLVTAASPGTFGNQFMLRAGGPDIVCGNSDVFYLHRIQQGYQITSAAVGDTTPPSAPTFVTAAATAPNRVTVQWGDAQDSESGVVTHHVYRDGTLVAEVSE